MHLLYYLILFQAILNTLISSDILLCHFILFYIIWYYFILSIIFYKIRLFWSVLMIFAISYYDYAFILRMIPVCNFIKLIKLLKILSLD